MNQNGLRKFKVEAENDGFLLNGPGGRYGYLEGYTVRYWK